MRLFFIVQTGKLVEEGVVILKNISKMKSIV